MSKVETVSVTARYREMAARGDIAHDRAQEAVARRLDALLEETRTHRLAAKSSALGWLFAKKKRRETVEGLYIHGAVGRGKTMLMDIFFQLVPARRKRRAHFHDFMADVHERIHAHRQRYKAGETKQTDPIPPVAESLVEEAWVLCFDEFSVTDIADAMILSRLFEQLFRRGAVLVATSNVAPDSLYRDGLNRSLFEPFIALLKTHVAVVNLDARTDYRLEKTAGRPVYMTPLNAAARAAMDDAWAEVTEGARVGPQTLTVKGRPFEVPRAGAGAARFSFDTLCRKAHGAGDYLALARRYHTLFVDEVPVLAAAMRNETKRFIILVDTLYDQGVRLFVSAAAPPKDLLAERRGQEGFEFDRTVSRLIEMQSAEYRDSAAERRQTAAVVSG